MNNMLVAALKMPTESVVESQCSVYEHCLNKRRASVSEENRQKEFFLNCNGPPIGKAEKILTKALNQHFGKKWHFQTRDIRKQSYVLKRLKKDNGKLPFLREIKLFIRVCMAIIDTELLCCLGDQQFLPQGYIYYILTTPPPGEMKK